MLVTCGIQAVYIRLYRGFDGNLTFPLITPSPPPSHACPSYMGISVAAHHCKVFPHLCHHRHHCVLDHCKAHTHKGFSYAGNGP